MPIQEALRLAREAQLDLVEISPQADPPVAQIMDFGKFLYEQHKKEREAKKAQKVIEVKEISPRLGHGLDENAIKTVKKWKFEPARREGVPVTVRVMVEVSFRL